MKRTNWLADVFDYAGEIFEKFNPSAYRFLAAVLPYLTPLPVAWLTADSASEFLNFPPNISFVFVFALEGIGLWFTSLLVDAIVDWVRSRNWKTFAIILMFGIVVTVYVTILVDLNVTLENAVGNGNPALSRIITLMCYLPLITGVGNGYYKLKLEHRTETERARQEANELAERVRQEKRQDKNERYKMRYAANASNEQVPNVRKPTEHRTNESANDVRKEILQYIEHVERTQNRTPGPSEIHRVLKRSKSYASDVLRDR